MNIYEAIFSRRSVRHYLMDELTGEQLAGIRQTLEQIKPLFGGSEVECRIFSYEDKVVDIKSLFTVKAPYYMAVYAREGERSAMDCGYVLQQISLYMTTAGIGSCYLGGTNLKKMFRNLGEKRLVMVMAFGLPKGSVLRKPVETSRLSLEELCVFKEVPRQWMNQLLEAARMAPSALNSQPWRFVVYDNRIHVFSKKRPFNKFSDMDEVNFGIMFANLMMVAEELWLDIDLIRLDNISQMSFSNNSYVLSAILKP